MQFKKNPFIIYILNIYSYYYVITRLFVYLYKDIFSYGLNEIKQNQLDFVIKYLRKSPTLQ